MSGKDQEGPVEAGPVRGRVVWGVADSGEPVL